MQLKAAYRKELKHIPAEDHPAFIAWAYRDMAQGGKHFFYAIVAASIVWYLTGYTASDFFRTFFRIVATGGAGLYMLWAYCVEHTPRPEAAQAGKGTEE
ncbi:hypothetical protein [Marinomonas sp.]|uniref:hypothetical protein n=1 Tax=Marinomonas sp. TaxID=1904862 RepID=UPI003A8EF520